MAVGGFGPGQDSGGGRKGGSWAQMLGSTLPTRLSKNVLEVVLDKDDRGGFNVSDSDCFRMMKKIGLDAIPGQQVEGVQICPQGRGVILITLRDGVALDVFCRYDVFEVTESGIRAVNVKPAGKREVVITVKGLHPNTRDQGVTEYLAKFGRVVTTKVVHAIYGEGPLKGLKNGDRSFKIELKPGCNIGSYHILDGQKVTVKYSGQQQTCARCHEVASNCPGGGIARRCDAAGGKKVELGDYILDLWKKIGYTPGELEVASAYDDHGDAEGEAVSNVQAGGVFTPTKVFSEPGKFAGVTIKQFPKDTDSGDIMEFLANAGLPETNKESVLIKSNGYVTIKNLGNDVCRVLIENIHNKKYLDRKLFCNGIIPLTPEKLEDIQTGNQESSAAGSAPRSTPAAGSPPSTPGHGPKNPVIVVSKENNSSLNSASSVSPSQSLPGSRIGAASVEGSPALSLEKFAEGFVIPEEHQMGDEEFLRRRSVYLKTPPPGSLADDICPSLLRTKTPPPGSMSDDIMALGTCHSLLKTRTILSEIKQLSEQLSDFGSCVSSLSESCGSSLSGSCSDVEDSSKDVEVVSPKKKKKKKRKRKSSSTSPETAHLEKKVNSELSPVQAALKMTQQ